MTVDDIHFAQLRAQNQAEILLPRGGSLLRATSKIFAATIVAACLITAAG